MVAQYAFRFDEKVTTTDTNTPQRVLGFRTPTAQDGAPQPFVLVEYCGAITGAWYYPHELERVAPQGDPHSPEETFCEGLLRGAREEGETGKST